MASRAALLVCNGELVHPLYDTYAACNLWVYYLFAKINLYETSIIDISQNYDIQV